MLRKRLNENASPVPQIFLWRPTEAATPRGTEHSKGTVRLNNTHWACLVDIRDGCSSTAHHPHAKTKPVLQKKPVTTPKDVKGSTVAFDLYFKHFALFLTQKKTSPLNKTHKTCIFLKGSLETSLFFGRHSSRYSWPSGLGSHRCSRFTTSLFYFPNQETKNTWNAPLVFSPKMSGTPSHVANHNL